MSEEDSQMITEYGEVLVDELNRMILPLRETPEALAEYGYVVYNGEETAGADLLAKFFVEYGAQADTSVTMVFSDTSFVVARVVFKGGRGVYLRYEYNALNAESLDISGQPVDGVALTYDEQLLKWQMALSFKGREVAGFSLYNPQD